MIHQETWLWLHVQLRARSRVTSTDFSAHMMLLQPCSEPLSVLSGVIATAITLGTSHSCVIIADGGVKCWGSNNQGQLGTGSVGTTQYSSPVDAIVVSSVLNLQGILGYRIIVYLSLRLCRIACSIFYVLEA